MDETVIQPTPARTGQPGGEPAPRPPRPGRLLWVGIPLLAIVLGGVWIYRGVMEGLFTPIGETESTIIASPIVLEAIRRVEKQTFIEHYNAVDLDYTEAPEGWLRFLPIERQFVILLRGRVPAGFDLSTLTSEDVRVSGDGTRVELTLPRPEIFEENVSIDFENSRILTQRSTCPNFICRDPLSAYQEEILPNGSALLVRSARRNGILGQAASGGVAFYERLLGTLGFEQVVVRVEGPLEP
ncbi:MAG: DUF4230 domain-containing protein [Longimicrobiaceae bacterium]